MYLNYDIYMINVCCFCVSLVVYVNPINRVYKLSSRDALMKAI